MPPFDEPKAHRWFAIEYNNLAWELWEKQNRTPDENERLVQLAHASCLHWSHVGKPENTQRGFVLLTCALTAASHAESAAIAARRCVELTETHDAALSDFDRATAFGSAAVALNDDALAQRARDYISKLTHPDDLRVARQILP